MTGSGLSRRLTSLEEAELRSTCGRVADEQGVDADRLVDAVRRSEVERRRLQAQGLTERALWGRLAEWVANDIGVNAGELKQEWRRLGLGPD